MRLAITLTCCYFFIIDFKLGYNKILYMPDTTALRKMN